MKFMVTFFAMLVLSSAPSLAQENDKGFIARLLEDSLAGEGRTVEINGFRGALSKRATIDSIVILDDEGPWVRLNSIALQLNRTALLRGRVEVDELSAESIELSRLPTAKGSESPPAAAQGFSLPQLPVSIDIKQLRADRIILGEPVLGEKSELSLTAALSLIDGIAIAKLNAKRIDKKRGNFDIDVGFGNEDQTINLDISLDEGKGGIAARLLGLPGDPSTNLSIKGSGSLDDLTAVIDIATDGEDRIYGTVQLTPNTTPSGVSGTSRSFTADIGGDIATLFVPQYRPFFGDDISLKAKGSHDANGTFEFTALDLTTDALSLVGTVALNADFWPTKLDLNGHIGNATGTLITLPIPGAETKIRDANLDIQFNHEQGDAWSGAINFTDLERDGIEIASANLNTEGTLSGKVGSLGRLSSAVEFGIDGISLTDLALMQAVGEEAKGSFNLNFIEGKPLELFDMKIFGSDFNLTGNAMFAGLESGLETIFDTQLSANDISRYSGLVSRELKGSVNIGLQGTANLGGEFDLEMSGQTHDLTVAQEQIDKLLRGQTDLTLKAARDTSGTRIENLALRNNQWNVDASGFLSNASADLTLRTTLKNTSDFSNILEGPATVAGTATQRDGHWSVDVSAAGPFETEAAISGIVTGPNARISYDASLPNIAAIAPNYVGAVSLNGEVSQSSDGWNLDTNLSGPYDLSASANGRLTGQAAPDISFDARLPNIAPLVPKISGPLAVAGSLRQVTADKWAIDANASGPSGTSATVSGNVSPNGRMNMAVVGDASLALVNPFIAPRSISGGAAFNLRIDGPANLSSVTGTLNTRNARIFDPNVQFALQGIVAEASLSSGRANIDLRGNVSSGGILRVSGPIGLEGSVPANLTINLERITLNDPTLYTTSLDGVISVNGPLVSGAAISGNIDVGETSISIPASGVSSFGTIPHITHIDAASDVRRTQKKAGLIKESSTKSGSSGAIYPLDITINAPRKIFVRGRGLDAELGGRLRLTGTTAKLVSAGRFELVRGRLDVLTKRFDLDEGSIQLQGDFDPFLRFMATTNTTVGTASVVVEGSASDPQVRFESSPEAPQDEILAQIFFGRDVSQISALQALQLASAVATLAGKGGEGIVSKLRRGFNLDDLDITTDEQGNAGVRAGKYISENIYTDVTVGNSTGPEVSLNIDLTPTIKATGKLGADGDTALGLYFLKDY